MLSGAGFTAETALFVSPEGGAARQRVAAQQRDNNSLTFLLPAGAAGSTGDGLLPAFDVSVAANATAPAGQVLRGNAPEVWWWQGDRKPP